MDISRKGMRRIWRGKRGVWVLKGTRRLNLLCERGSKKEIKVSKMTSDKNRMEG